MFLRRMINLVKAHNGAVIALLPLSLSACASVDGQIDQRAKAELISLQDQWIAAEIAGDADTLRSLMDERFVSTSSSGETTDREGYIDWITSFEVKPFAAVLDKIELHGDTAILVTLIGDHTKITWVAIRKDDRWVGVEQTFLRMKTPDT